MWRRMRTVVVFAIVFRANVGFARNKDISELDASSSSSALIHRRPPTPPIVRDRHERNVAPEPPLEPDSGSLDDPVEGHGVDPRILIPMGNYYARGYSYVPFSRTGDVFGVFGDSLTNMFEPVFVAILALLGIIGSIWLFSAVVSFLALPLRFIFGVKKPLLRRFVVRLISYMGQELVTGLRTSAFPFSGKFLVPAEGLQLSRPVKGDIPGFTLDMPATTIKYSFNLAAEAATKIQALLDAFNEVFNVNPEFASGRHGGGAARRGRSVSFSQDEERAEEIASIAGEIKEIVGTACEDDPTAVRDVLTTKLCRRVKHALKLAADVMRNDVNTST